MLDFRCSHPLNGLRKLVDLTFVGLGLSDSAVN
jgi:hypothetical protein